MVAHRAALGAAACTAAPCPARRRRRTRPRRRAPRRSRSAGGGRAQDQRQALLPAADQPGLLIEERDGGLLQPTSRGRSRTVVEELVEGLADGARAAPCPRRRSVHRRVRDRARRGLRGPLEGGGARSTPGGSEDELLTVYSVVNSLTANFPAVKRVQILVDDRQVADPGRPRGPDAAAAPRHDLLRRPPSPPPVAAPASPAARPRAHERPRLGQGRALHRVRDPRDDAPRAPARRGEPVAGLPRLPGPGGGEGGGAPGDRRRRQPVRDHLGRALAARGHRGQVRAPLRRARRPRARGHRHLRLDRGHDRRPAGRPRPGRRGGGASSPSTRTTARTPSSPAPCRAS